MRPPFGMASIAFFSKLSSTCLISRTSISQMADEAEKVMSIAMRRRSASLDVNVTHWRMV
ncbi:hypothetical protein D3C83_86380 [compost metagenome]